MLLLPGLGSLLVLLLASDVFLTVFHSRGRGGPVSRRHNRLLWAMLRRLARGSHSPALLSLGGPVMVVATIAMWVLLLVTGFALIFYPWVATFLVSPGSLRTPWAEALYYSAYTAATLGFGDVVANSEALRLITTLEAFGGFALLSVSMTYFLSVYRQLIVMQSLAADISGLFASGGPERVVDFAREEGHEVLARWSEQLSRGLSTVLLSHFQYPVLHYFWAKKPSRALPVQLGPLLGLRRLVLEADSPPMNTFAVHPSFRALEHALEEYLGEVDSLFIPKRFGFGDGPKAGDDVEQAHGRLLAYMRYT